MAHSRPWAISFSTRVGTGEQGERCCPDSFSRSRVKGDDGDLDACLRVSRHHRQAILAWGGQRLLRHDHVRGPHCQVCSRTSSLAPRSPRALLSRKGRKADRCPLPLSHRRQRMSAFSSIFVEGTHHASRSPPPRDQFVDFSENASNCSLSCETLCGLNQVSIGGHVERLLESRYLH